jgi:hypothetical protein
VEKIDFDNFGRMLERLLGRTASLPRWWVGIWLAGILVVTAIATISHAPVAAYAILALVAGMAVCAEGGDRRAGGSDSESGISAGASSTSQPDGQIE